MCSSDLFALFMCTIVQQKCVEARCVQVLCLCARVCVSVRACVCVGGGCVCVCTSGDMIYICSALCVVHMHNCAAKVRGGEESTGRTRLAAAECARASLGGGIWNQTKKKPQR